MSNMGVGRVAGVELVGSLQHGRTRGRGSRNSAGGRRGPACRFAAGACLLLGVVCLLTPAPARAWGSATSAFGGSTSFPTHQFIDGAALERLSSDDAFAAVRPHFPGEENIADFSGVVLSVGGAPTGNGPDGSGPFSWHYFNPVLPGQRGGAPGAAGAAFRTLVSGLQGDPQEAARGAAWSSHFVADLFVPYHVVGADRPAISRIYNEQCPGGKTCRSVELSSDISGPFPIPRDPARPAVYFKLPIEAFLNSAGEEDWFDPWYWDGGASTHGTSTHVLWEARVQNGPIGDIGCDPLWKNAGLGFPGSEGIEGRQAALVQEFAARCAARTRVNSAAYQNAPIRALRDAAGAVYTIWRASFSALRLVVDIAPAGEGAAGDEAREVTCEVTNSDGRVPATGVRARLKVMEGGSLSGGNDVLPDRKSVV